MLTISNTAATSLRYSLTLLISSIFPCLPQICTMARKVKGDKKKSKKKQALTPEQEKTRMITVLATKCNLKTEDVEEAYDKFHSKYKDGFIKREEYIQSRKVNKILSLNFPPVSGWLDLIQYII